MTDYVAGFLPTRAVPKVYWKSQSSGKIDFSERNWRRSCKVYGRRGRFILIQLKKYHARVLAFGAVGSGELVNRKYVYDVRSAGKYSRVWYGKLFAKKDAADENNPRTGRLDHVSGDHVST